MLIFVHELGHFIVAKKSGMRVDEFAIGFPPRVFSKKYGETAYSINAVPFGGYVKIHGENPNEDGDEGPDSKRSFANKNRGLQVAVLVAGVLGNVIFAWFILSLGFLTGMPAPTDKYENASVSGKTILISGVVADSPAAEAGILAGDVLIKIGSGGRLVNKPTMEQVEEIVSVSSGEPVYIEYERGTESKETSVIPQAGIFGDKPAIGIEMVSFGQITLPFWSAVYEGGVLTYNMITAVIQGLGGLLVDVVSFKADFSNIVGPVGIAGIVGTASDMGFGHLLSITALISVHLAVINLAPFPALDGGRILFVLVEAIIRRRINPKIQNYVNGLGFLLLMVLMMVITYRDIVKLF